MKSAFNNETIYGALSVLGLAFAGAALPVLAIGGIMAAGVADEVVSKIPVLPNFDQQPGHVPQ